MGQIIKRTPYHQQAYELLKSKILTGELACGEKINEMLLSQEMGISRSPVREAIRMLERDSLIITSGGTHVVNPLDEETLNNVYECRICLESYAARLACRCFTQEDYDTLTGFVLRCQEANPQDDWMLIDQNTYYHDYIASLTKNDYLIELLGRIRDIVILSRIKELKCYSRDISYAYKDHIQIAQRMLAGDEDGAEQLMREHLSNNRRSLTA